jgi:hypothetical protein
MNNTLCFASSEQHSGQEMKTKRLKEGAVTRLETNERERRYCLSFGINQVSIYIPIVYHAAFNKS